MKVFCLAPNPHANGAGLNFKSNLRPAALACFTSRENFKNLAPHKHCADRKNFKIFASDEIEFTTHGEPKFKMRSMVKFAVRRRLKFEPCGTAAREFAMRDKILSSSSRENCVSFKILPLRGAEKKQNEI